MPRLVDIWRACQRVTSEKDLLCEVKYPCTCEHNDVFRFLQQGHSIIDRVIVWYFLPFPQLPVYADTK